MTHLLGVASFVMGESGHVYFPVTEEMVIGALLHDAVEDEGGLPRLRDIEANFGTEVAKIVEGFVEDLVVLLTFLLDNKKGAFLENLRRAL